MSISDGDRAGSLPRGPHGLTRSYVARNQRERLLAAMREKVGEDGFCATSVTDVIERAGVSRKTFYAQFRDRTDCLLAAHSACSEELLARVGAAGGGQGPGEASLRALLHALCEAAIESPGLARLCAVEVLASGPEGVRQREATVQSLGTLLGARLAPAAGSAPSMPSPTLMTLVSAALRVVDLRSRVSLKPAGAKMLANGLAAWLCSYEPAPAAVATDARIATENGPAPLGGRAPGTLSLAPKKLVAGTRSVSPSLTAHNQRERILDATAELSASRGYIAFTVDEACGIAGVSLNTFYEHFENKRDAFLVAHELGHIRGVAIVERATVGAGTWQDGVREGVAALLSFLSSEPSFTRLAAVDAPIAAPETAARAARHLAAYTDLLLSGAPRSRQPPAVLREAIASSLHEIAFSYAIKDAVERITDARHLLSYIVLAPYLGPKRAGRAIEPGAAAGTAS